VLVHLSPVQPDGPECSAMLLCTAPCVQVEARQKLVEAKEKEEVAEKRAQIDEDAPGELLWPGIQPHTLPPLPAVTACHEKAVYLLKFAGLSRVAREEEELEDVDGSSTPRLTLSRHSSQHWQKPSNAISTVGKLKQQVWPAPPHTHTAIRHTSLSLVLSSSM